MSESITPRQFHEAVGVEDWRVLFGGAHAHFRNRSRRTSNWWTRSAGLPRPRTTTRLAQALHHGTDHRTQICTALTKLGVEPPSIDVRDFGAQAGRVVDVPPTS